MQKPRRYKFALFIFIFVASLVVIRALAPGIILKQLNKYLDNFSSTYTLHIDDLDLHVWKAAYGFDNIVGKLKNTDEKFLVVKRVDVSLAWRELLRFRILTDITASDSRLVVTKKLFKTSSWQNEDEKNTRINEAKEVRDTLFPVNVEKLTLRNSTFQFTEELQIPTTDRLVISDINATILNLTPLKERPLTVVDAKGKLMGDSTIRVEAQLNMMNSPLDWDTDIEMQKYDLTTANGFLRRMVPLTFNRGLADVYLEAKTEKGVMVGYVKPFLKDIDIMGDNQDYKGIKHFFFEVVGAVANALLKDKNSKTLATQINFSEKNGKLEIDKGEAFDKAWDHGTGKPLNPQLNRSIELKGSQRSTTKYKKSRVTG